LRFLILALILGVTATGCHDDDNTEWEAELVHELDTGGTAGGFSAGGSFNSGSKAQSPDICGQWQHPDGNLTLEADQAVITGVLGSLFPGTFPASVESDRLEIGGVLYIIAEATESSLSLIPTGPDGIDDGFSAIHLSR
jgi:hypothetical protein